MRLLIVSRDFPPAIGGIQTTIVELARQLSLLGHEVVVMAPEHRGPASHDRALPFEVVRLTVPWQQMNAAAVGAMLVATDLRLVPEAHRHKAVQVSWGVNTRLFAPRDKRSARTRLGLPLEVPIITYVGSFKAWHDVLTVARAIDVLGRRDVCVAMVGDGPR